MEKRYSIGVDFGTLSVRALIADMDTGEEKGTAVCEYPHAVMTEKLPDGTKLPKNFSLAYPEDYLKGMTAAIREAMRESGIGKDLIKGIGVDATSASVLPIAESGEPLCMLPEFVSRPHAYIKLWKHHGAAAQAQRMSAAAQARHDDWISYYGGNVSPELFLPKALETEEEDPEVWNRAYRYLEVGDWITRVLTGEDVRSMPMAFCNSFYRKGSGYPPEDFWKEIAPAQEPVTRKIFGRLIPIGGIAGKLTEEAAAGLGLHAGTPVAASLIDSHASVPGCGADRAGDMVLVIGTSVCYMMNTEKGHGIPGIYSGTEEANIPGLFGYEGGQSSGGDSLEWFVKRAVPAEYEREAAEEKISIHEYLTRKASALAPGESGLIALDWWNGVRSPFMDPKLTGVMTGLTLHTKPEELYRAMIESVCFGGRRVLDLFGDNGVEVKRIIAGGGIARKNPMMMQIMADVLNREISVCRSRNLSALGSAIAGACAAEGGTAEDCLKAVGAMHSETDRTYRPEKKNAEIYENLYRRFLSLSDYFLKFEHEEESGNL
jgi:L-ribulokinase